MSISPYLQNRTRWHPKFRTVAGLRGDFYDFDVASNDPRNSGQASDGLASPKLSLIFGPWFDTEYYINLGYGFHSNDGRGTAIYYRPLPWLTFDADFSFSKARFSDDDPAGDHIPGAIETVIAAGVTIDDLKGFFGGLRVRYFGPRPLTEDDSVRSSSTTLLNADVGYKLGKDLRLGIEVFNLLDSGDSDIEYFYPSRLPGEPAAGVDDIHFHPVEPRSVRVTLGFSF